MVHSVMAVSKTGKLKRDNQRSTYSDEKGNGTNKLFETILKEAAHKQEKESAPRECQTTLYNRECVLQNFNYLTREYHY